tara:strand:- start:233 stop:1000 length:768 start_codon:yes stop_codon:yes gene_type:complete
MELDFIKIIFLSLIQGISEFLPISSTAHLILFEEILNLENENLLIDISLHLGSLLAIIFYFREDFLKIKKNYHFFLKILIATIPLLPIGYLLTETGLINELRNLKTIAWSTLLFGIFLFVADKKKTLKKIDSDLSIKNCIIIGLFQVLSLIPGASRAATTIGAGRLLGFNRLDATKISFYLSIPALTIVSLFGIYKLGEKSFEFNMLVFFGVILSFIFSFITIKFFLKFIRKFSFNIFVIYRIILALILFIIIYY